MKNRICLWFAMFFISCVNRAEADQLAQWDDAQDYMENFARSGEIGVAQIERRLLSYGKMFECLKFRAEERANDVLVEGIQDQLHDYS
jgi:hypothetical protein